MNRSYSKVSLVELDDVCHNNGAAMYDAIRRYQIKVWLWTFTLLLLVECGIFFGLPLRDR